MDLYREIVRIREAGERAALATIVRRVGSAPRKDSAKMLVRQDGSFLGSVGGGCVEAEVWQAAREVIETGQPSLIRHELKEEDAENEGLICGGVVEVFVEPILSDPRLIILGAGHLGQAIARIGKMVGFHVAVVDDREAFANRERFPDADEIVVAPFERALGRTRVDSNSFVVIVTRGHSHDRTATEAAVAADARYVGLVGSRRKIKIIVESLLQSGHPPERFRNLYAPIGLPVGAETPEEIAVAVIGELIALRKGEHQRSEKQEFIHRLVRATVETA